jgi:hypothetical protein
MPEKSRKRTRFRPGRSGNPSGRPKGTPNKATQEIRESSRRLLVDPAYVDQLKRRIIAGKAPHMETLLHHYAYGKPPDHLDVSGSALASPVFVRFIGLDDASALRDKGNRGGL